MRGEADTVRAPRERAAPAVMSIAPSCTIAPTTAPTPVGCTVAPTTAPAPVSSCVTPTVVHSSAELVGAPRAAAMKGGLGDAAAPDKLTTFVLGDEVFNTTALV